jgi:malate-CoA ligase subunit alpha
MSILIDEKTPVIVQGFTGDKATFHAKEMIAYGTDVVGGVTPGKGGQTHLDRPVFNTVKDAVKPPAPGQPRVRAAGLRRRFADGGGRCRPEAGVHHHRRHSRAGHDAGQALPDALPEGQAHMIVGPNCAGIISAGKAMLGIMPGHIYRRGNVGIVSRSGTLGYEAAAQMNASASARPPASASAATRSTAARSWIT